MTKLDILVFAAHPDDAELGCAGTLARQIALGHKAGIVDLTAGELGTRGTAETRAEEAMCSKEILGLTIRENLNMPDGFFSDSKEECLEIIQVIRRFRPEIILFNAPHDRHPDHGMGARLITKAGFLSGLRKINTTDEGIVQEPWRAKNSFQYIQDRFIAPDVVVDITDYWDIKLNAIRAFKTQFFDPESNEPESYISSPEFMEFIEARAKELGHSIGVKYGEGFVKQKNIGVHNLFDLI